MKQSKSHQRQHLLNLSDLHLGNQLSPISLPSMRITIFLQSMKRLMMLPRRNSKHLIITKPNDNERRKFLKVSITASSANLPIRSLIDSESRVKTQSAPTRASSTQLTLRCGAPQHCFKDDPPQRTPKQNQANDSL